MAMTREQAWDLLSKYNKEPFHLRHAITVEHVMGWFAEHLGYGEERELWSLVGLLHDLDFEMWPEEHCKKSQELMRQAGVDEIVIRATASHGWDHCVDLKPELPMEQVLFAVDELTGLIGAAALMRPSKSVADMELKSLKKKFKDKKFAAGCSRWRPCGRRSRPSSRPWQRRERRTLICDFTHDFSSFLVKMGPYKENIKF